MAQPKTLLEEKSSLGIFKSLLNNHLGTSEAIINLDKIPQWTAFRKLLKLETTPLCHARTLLINGFFYNFTSPVPNEAELQEAFHIGKEQQVDFYIVPTVRESDDTSILENNGFIKVPFYVESIFEIEKNIDRDIKLRTGSDNFLKIQRYNRRAEQSYSFSVYKNDDLIKDTNLLLDAAQLHEENVKKYNHSIDLYDYNSLISLTYSDLKNNILVVLQNDNNARSVIKTTISVYEQYYLYSAVQAFINFFDMDRKHLYIMVQGKKDQLVEVGNNLYVATFYKLFKLAEALGIKEIHMGRGAYKNKKKLGANKFNILNNWVKPANSDNLKHINKLKYCANDLIVL